MRHWLRLLLRDDAGEDVIEYALLAAFIGLAGAAVMMLLSQTLGNTYSSWVGGVQGLWEPPAPAGS